MPTPWKQVEASPQYQALPPEQREAARRQYFDQVVAPQVPAEQLDAARSQFDQQTGAPRKPAAPAQKPKPLPGMIDASRKPQMGILDGARVAMRAKGNTPGLFALDAFDAFQHHVGSALNGTGQLIHKGVTAAADAVLPEGNSFRQWADNVDRKGAPALLKREADYQRRVPTNAASVAGATVGEVLPWMYGMGELRAAGLVPKIAPGTGVLGKTAEVAKKGGLLALEGGAYGATQPVTGDGSYGSQKGVQVGLGALAAPTMGGAVAVGGATGRGLVGLSRYATPAGREAIADARLAKLYGSDAEVIQQLRTQTGVQGFDLTPAQALKNPRAVQAERVLRNNGETAPAFAEREAANNAAARNQVARVAGTDADLAAAQKARSEGPGAFWRDNLPRGAEEGRYGRAQAHLGDFINSKPLPMPEFKILDQARKIAGQVQRGSMSMEEGDKAIRALAPTTKGGKKAMEQALGLIDGGMVNPNRLVKELQRLAKDTNPSISGAAKKALGSLSENQDGMGYVHGRVLDGLRQNFGKLIADSSPNGVVGSAEGAAFGPVKAKITNSLDRAVPGYRGNLAAYARASQPINDMEAGRALLSAIDGGGRDSAGGQAVNLNQVRAMLAKDNRANFPMSDSARQQIGAVLEVLQQRSVTNNTVAAAGPGTAADVQRAIQNSPLLMRLLGYGASGVGGMTFGPVGLVVGAAATEGANALNNSILRQLGQKASSARTAADALEAHRLRSMPKPQQQNIMDYLLPYEQKRLPPPR